MNLALLYSRIREDEKLLLSELRERDHEVATSASWPPAASPSPR